MHGGVGLALAAKGRLRLCHLGIQLVWPAFTLCEWLGTSGAVGDAVFHSVAQVDDADGGAAFSRSDCACGLIYGRSERFAEVPV